MNTVCLCLKWPKEHWLPISMATIVNQIFMARLKASVKVTVFWEAETESLISAGTQHLKVSQNQKTNFITDTEFDK